MPLSMSSGRDPQTVQLALASFFIIPQTRLPWEGEGAQGAETLPFPSAFH